ncbi:hypothetical protein H310_11226 [Aphanomyces invadans]|uniref:FYVE-type domain-containing protein n=1 Tax=Aphanomyces invadans TaxID=157072 RepID=A0A024TMV6_9STRA|nr:hypothetical protein H310_11226 [Aphanomyces invadans]ETV95329.1 hypothetical protein H310_11226 [Aphanomyces invadans]|eukprot:XP_008876030.1 hypothetical protein H310_11226 [Aphanomyces invadans]
MQGLQGYELGLGDCMAIKASMGLVVKDFLARSTVATRDVDALHDGYKLVTSKPNSRVYTRRAAHPSLKECLTIGRTTDMSLEDFSYLSYSDTTEQFKSDQAIFYEHNFHDAAVLTNVHKKTNDDPFLYFGVKYKRLSIPSSGLAEVRDTVFFEYSGTAHDAAGNRVFFIVRDSEFLQNVPPTPNVVRLQFRALFLFTELDDGSVECVSRSFMNPNGIIPAWMCNRQLVRYASIIETMPTAVQYKRFLEKIHANLTRRPRKISAKTCIACNSKMSAFTFKALYNCAYCGEVMCAKCVVPVPRAIKTNSPPACAKEDFCKRCFVEAQTGRVPSASASRNSGEFGKSSLTSNDVEGSNLTSTTTQDELFETYVTTCNAIVKPGMFSKEGTASASSSAATSLTSTSTPLSSRDPSLDSAAAAFTQLQVSIEQQKALVSQMQQRLESRSHVG